MAIGSNPIRSSKRKELVAAKATVQNKLQNRSLVYATQLTSQANKSKRAIVDSGANTMLMALDTPLEGGGEGSKRKCWDFTGQKYVPMAKQGHVWMCFTDPNADSTGQGPQEASCAPPISADGCARPIATYRDIAGRHGSF